MSGQQVGSAIGFVAGFFLPGGPMVWSAIGGAIGGAIDPTKFYGPRLSDGMAVTAQDGIPNPWGHGTFAVGCNIINAFDLVEHKDTDDGKGSGQENITYTYSRSYALGICRAKRREDGTYDPIAGVLRATHMGKVVYDVTPDASGDQMAQNVKFLQTYKFYLGGEDQLPDPTLESYLGTGNVSAYRGQVYMVATDEDQAQHGSIGSWEFVVAMDGETNSETGRLRAPYYPPFQNTHEPLADVVANYTLQYIRQDGPAIPDPPNTGDWEPCDTILEAQLATQDFYASVEGQADRLPEYYMGWRYSEATFYSLDIFQDQPDVSDHRFVYLYYNDHDPDTYRDGSSQSCSLNPIEPGGEDNGWICSNLGVLGRRVPDDTPRQGYPGGSCLDGTTLQRIEPLRIWVERKAMEPTEVPAGAHAVPGLPGYYVNADGTLGNTFVEPVSGSFKALSVEDTDGGASITFIRYTLEPILESTDPDGTEAFWEAAYDAAVIAGKLPAGMTYQANGMGGITTYPRNLSNAYQEVAPLDTLSRDQIVLAEPVAECCRRSGLSNDDFDVSQLTDLLGGFKVAVQTTGEQIIQSLMPAFFFDCGEWDDKLRFIKRGADVVGELTVYDLAERDGPAIEETQVQEVELLRKVNVKAMDPDAGWVETTQVAERRVSTVAAVGEQTIQVAVVIDKDQQAQIADKRLKVAWSELRRFGYVMPYTLAKYTVTDVIGLTDKKGRRQRVRLMEASEDTGRIDVSEASLDRQSSYTSNVEGVQKAPPTDTSPGLIGPTYFWAGNLPSLRTSDNVPGVYIAACGYLRAWGGADILLSADGGLSFQSVGKIIAPCTMGVLMAGVTDSSEPIKVFMNSGELVTITDAQLADRQNPFAITTSGQSELGQFKTATLLAADTYDLTDTVRGALGTAAAAHNYGDPFVMVQSAIFLPLDISLAGRELIFKAVSFGTSPDDTDEYPFVFNPMFTSVTVAQLTEGGDPITVNGNPIYVVTSDA